MVGFPANLETSRFICCHDPGHQISEAPHPFLFNIVAAQIHHRQVDEAAEHGRLTVNEPGGTQVEKMLQPAVHWTTAQKQPFRPLFIRVSSSIRGSTGVLVRLETE